MGKSGLVVDTASRLFVFILVAALGLTIVTTGLGEGSAAGVVIGAVLTIFAAYKCFNLLYQAKLDLARQGKLPE